MVIVYVLALGIILWYIFYVKFTNNLVYVQSLYDGKYYLVRNLPDKEEASNRLARIREKLTRVCELLGQRYPRNKKVKLLIKRFDPNNLAESEYGSPHTSYSINKGEKIVFCIRTKDDKQTLIDENTVTFVALHELAHIMTLSVGHTKEFWENFRFILANAIHFNIYTPQNFKENPQPYCGTHITDSPLKLEDIPKYINFDQTSEEKNEAQIKK
jgi:hypothetical protein